MPYLTDLADVAGKTSLEVIEVPGWETRGRGEMSDVRAVVCHHTATLNHTADMPSLDTLIDGRPDLSGPLSHFGLSRSGKVYVIAAGRCNHAGTVQNPSWGNSHSIGIEAEATGTDATWPEVQMDAFAQLCRALVDHFGLSVSAVLGHKEVADPPCRKIDPNFDMAAFRARVSALGGTPPPVPAPAPAPAPAPTRRHPRRRGRPGSRRCRGSRVRRRTARAGPRLSCGRAHRAPGRTSFRSTCPARRSTSGGTSTRCATSSATSSAPSRPGRARVTCRR